MPRPVRAYGRPGTRVIPAGWGPSHAVVTDDTLTDTVVIFRPAGGPTFNPATRTSTRSEVPVYGGTVGAPATVTAGDGSGRSAGSHRTQGGQDVVVGRFTVRLPHAIDLHSSDGPLDDLRVRVVTSDDPALVGRVLVVDEATLAGRRFSRFLTATLAD